VRHEPSKLDQEAPKLDQEAPHPGTKRIGIARGTKRIGIAQSRRRSGGPSSRTEMRRFTDKCSASSVSDACPTVSDDCPAAASAPCPADVPGPCLAAGPCADARRTSSELSECESDGEEWGFFDKLSLGARDSEPQFKAAPLPRASLSDGSYLSRLCGYRSAELDAITRLVRVELDVPCAIISIACDNWIWVASVATTLDRKTFLKSHWLPSNLALCTHAIDRANKHNDRVCQVGPNPAPFFLKRCFRSWATRARTRTCTCAHTSSSNLTLSFTRESPSAQIKFLPLHLPSTQAAPEGKPLGAAARVAGGIRGGAGQRGGLERLDGRLWCFATNLPRFAGMLCVLDVAQSGARSHLTVKEQALLSRLALAVEKILPVYEDDIR